MSHTLDKYRRCDPISANLLYVFLLNIMACASKLTTIKFIFFDILLFYDCLLFLKNILIILDKINWGGIWTNGAKIAGKNRIISY